MKKTNTFFVFLVTSAWIFLLAFAFITGIKKAIKPRTNPSKLDATTIRIQQRQIAEEVKERQRQSMEDQKQRMEDMRRTLQDRQQRF
ncbi:MAG: hypothetical protein WC552_00060 [Candidatus Omnitrophota bacterium]